MSDQAATIVQREETLAEAIGAYMHGRGVGIAHEAPTFDPVHCAICAAAVTLGRMVGHHVDQYVPEHRRPKRPPEFTAEEIQALREFVDACREIGTGSREDPVRVEGPADGRWERAHAVGRL